MINCTECLCPYWDADKNGGHCMLVSCEKVLFSKSDKTDQGEQSVSDTKANSYLNIV